MTNDKKVIGYRLDANKEVASGHMMRCISIAKECALLNMDCIFFTAPDSMDEPIVKAGFKSVRVDLKWNDWDYGTENLIEAIRKENVDYMVVDSYRVTASFFKTLSKEVKILYLDDICKQVYDVDAVLHYSEWENENTIKNLYGETDIKVFSGMKYVPLRDEFKQTVNKEQRRIDCLITTGGTDKYHVTKKLIQAIKGDLDLQDLKVCAVFGSMNPDYEEMKEECENNDNIETLQNVSNMSELMRTSRFAVTAGGMSVYEMMACRTYFFVFSFSDDQTYFGERLEKHGNSVFAGDIRYEGDKVISNIVIELKKSLKLKEDEVEKIISANRECADGNGCTRIAKLIEELSC